MDPRTLAQLQRAAQGLNAEKPQLPPSLRPLQGLRPNQMGASQRLHVGDTDISIVEARTEADEAELLTLTARGQNIISDPVLGNAIVGRIEWGMGGAQFEARFDVLQGTTFSVVANYIRFSASMTQGSGPATVQVFGGIGYGTTYLRSSGARLTVPLGLIGAGGATTVPVPDFANSFIVQQHGLVIAAGFSAASIAALDSTALSIVAQWDTVNRTNAGSQQENTFPLPGDAAFIELLSPGGGNYRLLFNLAI